MIQRGFMQLPLQGASYLMTLKPRALPWAMSSCPLAFPSAADFQFRALMCGIFEAEIYTLLYIPPCFATLHMGLLRFGLFEATAAIQGARIAE